MNRDSILPAEALPPRCPQSPDTPIVPAYNYTGSEDCLFLNVYAPQNKINLPVLVWIHGGGYGAGQGNQDLSPIINTNNDNFIGVAIQYRLGAFGFLSSDEVYRYGTVNAGLKDMTFALQWVQSYIGLFGGNASAVTISGESAGGKSFAPAMMNMTYESIGGAVMLQSMAFGGELGNSLFNQVKSDSHLQEMVLTGLGNRFFTISPPAMVLCRFRPYSILLRLRYCGGMFQRHASKQHHHHVYIPVLGWQGHRDASKCQRYHFWLWTIRHLGISTCHRL